MSTLKAVVAGFVVSSALILGGGWAFAALAAAGLSGESYNPTLLTGLIFLLYTAGAFTIGAYIATRINDSPNTISGYGVAQAFFGFGLIREFWSTGSPWYTVAAVVLVIPCAMLGRTLERRLGIKPANQPSSA